MQSASEEIRESFGESDRKRDAGLITPDDVIRFDDIKYGELGEHPQWQMLDVYRPKAKTQSNNLEKLPVIVSVHGGGWVYGDKGVYQFYCMSLAQRGFAVVNYSYRLAPEYKFPAQLEDANQVFSWVLENADKYGFDTDNIFAVGDSAGAAQLGLYSAICTNQKYAQNYNFKSPEGFAPKAIALNCGVYVVDPARSDALTVRLMDSLMENGGTDEELDLINVTKHVTGDFPPVFVMTASGDFLKQQAPLLEMALIEQSVPHQLHFYGDSDNELTHVFHCNIKLDDATVCNDDEAEFFKRNI